MGLHFRAYNTLIPYKNTSGLASQAAILVTQSSVAIPLSDYFGNIGSGDYFTLQADGGKIYVSGAFNNIGSVNEQEQGRGVGVCWPIPDGEQLPVRILGGRQVSTGYATGAQVATGFFLHAKLALSGVATGFLRIFRSSVDDTQGIETLKPVGF